MLLRKTDCPFLHPVSIDSTSLRPTQQWLYWVSRLDMPRRNSILVAGGGKEAAFPGSGQGTIAQSYGARRKLDCPYMCLGGDEPSCELVLPFNLKYSKVIQGACLGELFFKPTNDYRQATIDQI